MSSLKTAQQHKLILRNRRTIVRSVTEVHPLTDIITCELIYLHTKTTVFTLVVEHKIKPRTGTDPSPALAVYKDEDEGDDGGCYRHTHHWYVDLIMD